jgi:hypothetical protein
MKFKRGDMGLYFALGLVGAGIGLLLGALVASRIEQPFEPEPPDEEEEQRLHIYRAPTVTTMTKQKKTVKKKKDLTTPEMEEFFNEFNPSAIQRAMVLNGLISIEDLKATLSEQEELTAPYNYSSPYIMSDKPDLEDLVTFPEDDPVIDDRYWIRQEPPKGTFLKSMKTIYWDPDDDDFSTLSRQKQVIPIGSLKGLISDEAWEVLRPYLSSGISPLFVKDTEKDKFYKFEIVPGDLEVFPDDVEDLYESEE